MNPDIRPWYHLLYVTDQIKSADQKAYLALAVVCLVFGFSNQGFARIVAYLAHGNVQAWAVAIIVLLLTLCVIGFVGALGQFYHIVFPKVNNQKFVKDREKSAIFWNDVAGMTFDKFKALYATSDREEDLVVQIYILSQITQLKYMRIKRLFTFSMLTVACIVVLFLFSKGLQ